VVESLPSKREALSSNSSIKKKKSKFKNSERDWDWKHRKELVINKGHADNTIPHYIITDYIRPVAKVFLLFHSSSQFTISLSVIRLQSSNQAPQCKGKT
jgi:hypothetical protein